MKQPNKTSTNITLSLPIHLYKRIHESIARGQISKFTAAALKKALDELDKKRELELEAMFKSAAKAEKKDRESKEWLESDNLLEIEGWEWYGQD